jgi:hypothetical protein
MILTRTDICIDKLLCGGSKQVLLALDVMRVNYTANRCKSPELTFSALLSDQGAPQVRFEEGKRL